MGDGGDALCAIGSFYLSVLKVLGCGSEPGTDCCPPRSLPPLPALAPTEALPTGTERVLRGLTVYVTGDEAERTRCVIVGHDVWGFSSGRHRQACDFLASKLGCAVYLPDLFHGSPVTVENGPGTPGFKPWAEQWNISRVTTDVDKLISAIGAQRVAFVGFCWGTFAGVLASAGGRVCAAAYVHPSHRKVLEAIHGWSTEASDALVARGRAATLLLAAANDDARCKPAGTDEVLLSAAGVRAFAEEFDEMKHGWVVKGDLSDGHTARDVHRALTKVALWFDAHLRGVL